ncbi:MAG: hypothetical protein HQL69_13885 [Magnetococcales bacterium]|nr:hypothetical protein [Magnetococcales bacterium]
MLKNRKSIGRQDLNNLNLEELLDIVEKDYLELWEGSVSEDEKFLEAKRDCQQLIHALKKEHQGILQELNEVLAYGVRTSEGMHAFKKAETIILNHVEKEKSNIISSLQKLSPDSKIPLTSMSTLKNLIHNSNNSMSDIMADFLSFFEKYIKDDEVSILVVHGEFIRITNMFVDRFELEESVIFEIYESILCSN